MFSRLEAVNGMLITAASLSACSKTASALEPSRSSSAKYHTRAWVSVTQNGLRDGILEEGSLGFIYVIFADS